MPQRLLRPGLTTSKRFNRVSWFAQALYVRLITLADDYGRLEADPELLRSLAFPFGDSDGNPLSVDSICQQMSALCGQNLIIAYEVDGKKYAQITKWKERARTESKLPTPPKSEKCQQPAVICQQMIASPPSPSPSPVHTLVPSTSTKPFCQHLPATARHLPAESVRDGKEVETSRSVGEVMAAGLIGPSRASHSAIEAARKALSAAYGRPLINIWPNDQERTLADVASRGDFDLELKTVLDYRASLAPDEIKFFPQSIGKLLDGWENTLERIRTVKGSQSKGLTQAEKQIAAIQRMAERL